jgi:hypothetical protein
MVAGNCYPRRVGVLRERDAARANHSQPNGLNHGWWPHLYIITWLERPPTDVHQHPSGCQHAITRVGVQGEEMRACPFFSVHDASNYPYSRNWIHYP